MSDKKKRTDDEKTVDLAVKKDDKSEDDDYLVEDDGDFFWVLQRVVWGVLKGLILIGSIGFFVWFIWGYGSNDTEDKKLDITQISKIIHDKVPKKDKNTTTTKPVDKNIPNKSPLPEIKNMTATNQSLLTITKAYQAINQDVSTNTDIITKSIQWLKGAKTMGSVNLDIIRIESPKKRSQKIEDTIIFAEKLLKESPILKKQLSTELETLKKRKASLEKEQTTNKDQIFQNLKTFKSDNINKLLEKQEVVGKEIASLSTKGKIREILLKNIKNFENLIYQKIIHLVPKTQIIQAPPKTPKASKVKPKSDIRP